MQYSWLTIATLMVVAGCQTPSALTRSALTRSRDKQPPVSLDTSLHPPTVSIETTARAATSDKAKSRVTSQQTESGGEHRAIRSTDAAGATAADVAMASLQLPVPLAEELADTLQLTLDNAIAVSLDRNPTLVALRASEPVASAAYRVSEVYPWNPFVQVQVLPYARDKAGDTLSVNHYAWLMQTIELAHQQGHREASALAALNQVHWGIVSAELTTSAQTQRLYFTALYQRELRDLAKRTAMLNKELYGVVDRQFEAGRATAAARTTAKVAARQSRRQAKLAEAGFRTAQLVLQRQLNLPGDEPMSLIGQLAAFSWQSIGDSSASDAGDPWTVKINASFVADLAQRRPDVLAAESGMTVAHANANLARANQKQNIAIGPIYERDESGTVFVGLRTQMNLPVWNNGRPLTAQREAEQNRQWIAFDQLRTQAEVEAATAIERYERARRILAQESSDQAEFDMAELQNIKDQFNAGKADILNVFTVQNNLLQEYRTYLDLLNEVAQAAADVTLMAGLPPARLITSD